MLDSEPGTDGFLVELTATGSQSILAEAPIDERADGSALSFFTDVPFAADPTWAVQLWNFPDGDKRTIRALIIPRG